MNDVSHPHLQTRVAGTDGPAERARQWIARALAAIALLLLASTVLGFGGRLWWVLGLFAPFRFQLLIGSALLALVLLIALRRRWRVRLPLAAAMISTLINAILIAPLWLPPAPPEAAGPTIKVMAFNSFFANLRLDELPTAREVAAQIEQSGADLVVIQEVTVHRLGVLRKALPGYRMVTGTGRPDAFGIALFVRRAAEGADETPLVIESAEEVELTGGVTNVRQVALRGRWRGRPLALLGVHTVSAVHNRSDRVRSAMLAGAARWAKEQQAEGRAVIVCGDFNATPWCPPFIDLLDAGDLHDSSRGFGVQGSWPRQLPSLFRIPIDHCVHSADLVTRQRAIGRDAVGSDHFPLIVELQWK